MIIPAVPEDYDEITELWEASVRATHHFLSEEDIIYYRSLIRNEYLHAVQLFCTKDRSRKIEGFIGLSGDKIEMLFIQPGLSGKGLGRGFLDHATIERGIRKVDVNEQNERAVGFYKHYGFKVVNRLPLDSLGKPYPVLEMRL